MAVYICIYKCIYVYLSVCKGKFVKSKYDSLTAWTHLLSKRVIHMYVLCMYVYATLRFQFKELF